MNTGQLKSFAQQARLKLMEQVGAKLHFVLNEDTASIRGKEKALNKLKSELNEIGEQALIEKVAYTWFNRLVAIRFMDANAFQPFNVSIISPVEGSQSSLAEVVELIQGGNIPEEFNLDRGLINDLLDGKAVSSNPNNEIMRMVLVEACNYYHSLFPFLFEKINDYTELLLPDDLVSPISILADVIKGMSKEDCAEVEIIGWLYQFYISEKKDEVFASTGKVKKEDIPAATQLFTPRWIVEYMVQNTVGKLWLLNKPNSSLKQHMPYYIETENTSDFLNINSVEEIKLLDQACGSGHILVYGFELLAKIYEEEGYPSSEIPTKIIENNLHGFEIDERASQLASFAIVMKARQYYRRFFRKPLAPNILTYKDEKFTEDELQTIFSALKVTNKDVLTYDIRLIEQATNFGSLIQPRTDLETLVALQTKTTELLETADLFSQDLYTRFASVLKQLVPLAQKYHCVVDNPPYMGDSNMNQILGNFVKENYPLSKYDSMVCFMDRAYSQVMDNGYFAMINYQSWMFVSSFSAFRNKFTQLCSIDSLIHLGRGMFGSDFGTVSFSIQKSKPLNKNGIYKRLFSNHSSVRSVEEIKNLFLENYGVFKFRQEDFSIIPNNNLCYWFSNRLIDSFKKKRIENIGVGKAGIVSGNDSIFLRLWYEIDLNKSDYNCNNFNKDKIIKTWYPINKGGNYRKYFGNYEYVMNLKDLWNVNKTSNSVRKGDFEYYFKEAVTWTYVCGTGFSFRYSNNNLFATAAPAIFLKEDNISVYYLLGLLNSKPINNILPGINPTVNLGSGDVSRLPFIYSEHSKEIVEIVELNLNITKNDWNSHDTSWDFEQNELVRLKEENLSNSLDQYKSYWKNQFFQLHQNEEELNRQFIEIYGLQEELTPDVPLEDITILKDETEIVNGELVFKDKEIIAQFISYAVGCIFGRYALDKEGLILANQGETFQDFLAKVGKTEEQLQFVPDADNIVPILEDEWFYDDIVTRVKDFVKAVWGEASYNENIATIENALGKDLRKYLVKDFYKDHIKRYKKRPIYWQFSSPKGAFNVLIYMHRYTKDTLSEILNGYLREFIGKLENHIQHLETVVVTGSAVEQAKARKEIDKLKNQIDECKAYEVELFKMAGERIEIDLDEGVLVNYNKFGNVIAPIAGLNDKKSKDKVKKFDWIDITQIR
ncbi:BREX-1 system adenine-specific DNA-methyltransferase PglX [Empedobacter falsenii]|uniref:BREX-1 system adenine-specific DNA-methyltransferase PglX n=1 Tax=Empedobacter falsenii TaxID=343874 RepID=UPI003A804D92